MERITDKYVFFWGSEFSNWFECDFTYKLHKFKNSEQAFMWEKARYFGDTETAALILKTPSPNQNKKLGRKVKNFNAEEWLKVGYDVMVAVNMTKFEQNEKLRQILLSTENKIIVEASKFDTVWGIGIHWENDDCLDKAKWKGMNLLGKALMEVREKIKNKIYENN